MSKQELEGKRKRVEGEVRDMVGKATGDVAEQVHGKVLKVRGRMEEAEGKARRKAKAAGSR